MNRSTDTEKPVVRRRISLSGRQGHHGCRKWYAAVFFAIIFTTVIAAPQYVSETDSTGLGEVRIENEIKLRVPREKTEAVWEWMRALFAGEQWLDPDGNVFSATFGDEDFEDVYYDTPDLRMLADESGIRYRTRYVRSGSAEDKHGRRLVQIKLNRGDPTGLARSEIKFKASGGAAGSDMPLAGMIEESQQSEFEELFRALGVNPRNVRPVLTLKQNRRRVYVDDRSGAFATLTLDKCSTTSWGTKLGWTDMELELNEIRYTEATEGERQYMETINHRMLDAILEAFPDIVQDQTPKYNVTFAAIEAATWLPVRRMIRWRLAPSDFIGILSLFLLGIAAVILYWVIRWRKRKNTPAYGDAG
ncbi:MAG TPA: CYTH domain-containing protein [bacterium]|nr:CYTH domain-containing protein [bacterium]